MAIRLHVDCELSHLWFLGADIVFLGQYHWDPLPPLPVDAGCDERQRRLLLADVLDGILLHPVLLGLLHRLDSSVQEYPNYLDNVAR